MKRLDTLFPYPTPKIARIKDSKLGLLRAALMCIILIYVVGYQIMWRGNHLEMQDLAGVYQMQLDHPTRNSCDPINVECMQNFTSMSTLPYCSQSPAASSIKLPCQYWDAQQLTQVTDQGLMIPTHISTYFQTPGCKPSVGNNWTCIGWLYDYLDKKGETQSRRGQASPIEDIFVADIERYSLMVDHSVRSTLGHRYYASEMTGYWLDCKNEHQSDVGCVPRPIHCDKRSCYGKDAETEKEKLRPDLESHPKFRGDRRSLTLLQTQTQVTPGNSPDLKEVALHGTGAELSEDGDEVDSDSMAALQLMKGEDLLYSPPVQPTPKEAPARADHLDSLGVVSLDQGDIFRIGMLLKAANVSLDTRRHNIPSWVGGSYRSSGFVLVVRIHYTNVESWLGLKVLPWKVAGPTLHYTYRVTKHASHDDFIHRQVQPGGPKDPKHSRVVKEYNGIRVLIEQSGSHAVWNNIQLLLILTTTLALMAVSNCITDSVALYCLPNSDEYWSIKYERPRTTKKTWERAMSPESDIDINAEPEDNTVHYSDITM